MMHRLALLHIPFFHPDPMSDLALSVAAFPPFAPRDALPSTLRAPAGHSKPRSRSATAQRAAPAPYDRNHELPRLLALWPHEIADLSLTGRDSLIAKLKRALREERRRGLAGHWTYDLVRHAGLRRAWQHELEARQSLALPGRSTPRHGPN